MLLTERIKKSYDRYAQSYDAGTSLQRDLADKIIKAIQSDAIKFSKALDIGCGTGYLISSLRAPEGGEAIPLNIIAHLKNNHYVVVTNIAADGNVTYREHNRGQNGYSWTVSRDNFENSWTGYAIVDSSLRAAGSGEAISSLIQAKKISDDTAMRIKGSCLPFLLCQKRCSTGDI